MGFHLSNLISYGTGTPVVNDSTGVVNNAQTQVDKGMEALKGMSAGETLQGEVVSVNGNEVEIKIADNAVINARLEQSMNVAVGQKMMFEVSNNQNGQIALRALFTNLAQEQLANNALQAAGISANDQSLQMIASLMKEGMSIDRQSLQSVYHDIVQFPDVEQSLLVHMHKIGMETTPQNVEQFQALVNYEERVAGTIQELINEIPAELKNMAANGEAGKVMAVTQELVALIAEHEGELALQAGENSSVLSAEGLVEDAEGDVAGKIQQQPEGVADKAPQTAMDKALAALEEAMNPQNQVHTLADGKEGNSALVQGMTVDGEEAILTGTNDKVLSGVLTKAEYTQLATVLEQNGFSKEMVSMVRTGELPMNELFNMLKAELASKDAATAGELWNDKGFSKLIGKELQNTWLLDPKEVENGKNVTEFYNRINNQVNSVIHSMAQSLSESSALMQNLQQFQENVDFLNQLNQFMPYVQLPLKMNGQSATGDLYVYADKRSLAGGKDTVSAALHLDMQHLGMVDVFVKMQDKNVSTEFCLESEETLDFIAEHMDMLSERLERRGYSLSTEMKVKEQQMSLKEDILPATESLSVESKSQGDAIAVYRFDVRA